jgi:hypothetical protein
VKRGAAALGIRRIAVAVTVSAVLLGMAFALYSFAKSRPQDMPWTPLDLGEKPGLFTAGKLVALTRDFPQCRRLLERAGVRYVALAPIGGEQCGYTDGVRLTAGGARTIGFAPKDVGMACPVAAAMAMLEWNVLQPAAQRHFGVRVRTIEHFGSYNCRRMYGRSTGDWSEHATADAIDFSGVVLTDGTRISVVGDWTGSAKKAVFLREVRDGACKLFSTVLSPDYNAAHRDHFHLDQADRGAMGWRACR